jgi:hypothetical protein
MWTLLNFGEFACLGGVLALRSMFLLDLFIGTDVDLPHLMAVGRPEEAVTGGRGEVVVGIEIGHV